MAHPLLLLPLLLLYGWHADAASVTTPARLVEGRYSIERLLRIPQNLKPGRYEVLCEGRIRKQGRTNSLFCYYKDDSLRSLVKAVRNAGSQARYVPATRDGVAVDVYMTLMVRIDTTTRDPLIGSQIQRMDFMPGYTADGNPVPMLYIEALMN